MADSRLNALQFWILHKGGTHAVVTLLEMLNEGRPANKIAKYFDMDPAQFSRVTSQLTRKTLTIHPDLADIFSDWMEIEHRRAAQVVEQANNPPEMIPGRKDRQLRALSLPPAALLAIPKHVARPEEIVAPKRKIRKGLTPKESKG